MASDKVNCEELNSKVWTLRGGDKGGFTNPLIIPQYHKDWNATGPIIEEAKINLLFNSQFGSWSAWILDNDCYYSAAGENPLEAALRCYLRKNGAVL